jgi:hypothetical protein
MKYHHKTKKQLTDQLAKMDQQTPELKTSGEESGSTDQVYELFFNLSSDEK